MKKSIVLNLKKKIKMISVANSKKQKIIEKSRVHI